MNRSPYCRTQCHYRQSPYSLYPVGRRSAHLFTTVEQERVRVHPVRRRASKPGNVMEDQGGQGGVPRKGLHISYQAASTTPREPKLDVTRTHELPKDVPGDQQ